MSSASKEDGVPTTIIGPTIIIRGKLKSDEDLVVEGRIEAEIVSTKALVIENPGIVKASVQVKSARVSGVVVGNITAEAKVEIAPDGRVVGDILTPKLVIRDGAAFRGRIDMPDFDAPRAAVPERFAAADAPRASVPEPFAAADTAAIPVAAVASPEEDVVAAQPIVPTPEPWIPPAELTSPVPAVIFGGDDEVIAAEAADDPFAPPQPPPKPPLAADRDRDRNLARRNKRW